MTITTSRKSKVADCRPDRRLCSHPETAPG